MCCARIRHDVASLPDVIGWPTYKNFLNACCNNALLNFKPFFGMCRLHQRKTKSSTGQTRTSHTVTYRYRNLHSGSRGSMSGCDLRTIFRFPSTRARTIEQLSSSTSTPSPNGISSRPTSPRNGSSSKGTPSSTFSRPFRSVQLHFLFLLIDTKIIPP